MSPAVTRGMLALLEAASRLVRICATEPIASPPLDPGSWQREPVHVVDTTPVYSCIAVTVAVKCPHAQVWAGDISPDALALARENAGRHGVAGRVRFVESDGFAGLPAEVRYELIVSNPPYIASSEISTLQPEVRDYDPYLALDGGADGLAFYRQLAEQGGARLQPGGRIMLEFGDGQAREIENIFTQQNWIVEAVRQDYSQRDRFLIAKRP